MTILVTGSAGFIGNHVALRLLQAGHQVVGVDCHTPYYDVRLKAARTERLLAFPRFREERIDLADAEETARVFEVYRPRRVVHLAAQAGVRYSLENPRAYVDSNLMGTFTVLEGCRSVGVEHLVFASTSSVYGANREQPFSEHHAADHPLTFYAATKRANEMMAHSYAHMFKLPSTALRFFTVYGPWGRPDMALFLFTEAILKGEPIKVFNHGDMVRDFTYIDDIVEGIVRVLDTPPLPVPSLEGIPDPATSPVAPFRVYNIGNSRPVTLLRYIDLVEEALGMTARKTMLPMQIGDVPGTWADVSDLSNDTGYQPSTPVEEGVRRFVAWYRAFYKK
ncbi:NAD-dependent epimerase [Pararhodospirillum photometricum]|uniref:UDP-glucuronate 5'-epimerase n=1 Tax=Pararhodospirillum photometricum DSM 122 TaxID=1150469 RepID=H6SMJ3_PARPM|nr:NAD-dependent epimerase [Pararhodospirillum photometricum]CCG09128.1 UDP-glucuronate 5'-epimerase [Pararhodospirillum photometricum DSM 122]